MLEEYGDLWEIPADVICITTNGDVNGRGNAVMGRGCAKQATERIPGIEKILGRKLKLGNDVWILAGPEWEANLYEKWVVSFPVKHHWHKQASINLIRKSARELLVLSQAFPEWRRILIPRPGCGNGRLDWKDVKPVLEDVLDNRFIIVTWSDNGK